MDLGQLYRSTAVLGAGDDLQPALRPDQWAGQPGTRAPHLWVTRNGERISTLDLFQREWVLLAEDERWCDAAAQASGRLGVKVSCKCIAVDLVCRRSRGVPDSLRDRPVRRVPGPSGRLYSVAFDGSAGRCDTRSN
jgi:hypothetical protein